MNWFQRLIRYWTQPIVIINYLGTSGESKTTAEAHKIERWDIEEVKKHIRPDAVAFRYVTLGPFGREFAKSHVHFVNGEVLSLGEVHKQAAISGICGGLLGLPDVLRHMIDNECKRIVQVRGTYLPMSPEDVVVNLNFDSNKDETRKT